MSFGSGLGLAAWVALLVGAGSAVGQGLPRAIVDDDFAAAVARMTAATAGAGHGAVHLRYELRMVDYKGREHAGSFEVWSSPNGHRTDILTDLYKGTEVVLPGNGGAWVLHDGPRPLRVAEFAGERVLPRKAIEIDEKSTPRLQAKKVKGPAQVCGGDGKPVEVCFDAATGWLTEAKLEEETVEYEGWKKVGSGYLAGVVRIFHDKSLLVEAKLTAVSDDVAAGVFAVPVGAVQAKAGTTAELFERPGFDPADRFHGMEKRGKPEQADTTRTKDTGNVQVWVWVDERGHVSKAEIEDADDKDLGASALSQAKSAVYLPMMVDGVATAFRTSVYAAISFNWSMRAGGTAY